MDKGLLHIYHGDGKGKTTAAMGLAARALGRGRRVCIVQYFKGRKSGEIALFEKLEGVTVLRPKSSVKFTWQMDKKETQILKAEHDALLEEARKAAFSDKTDLLILDEALSAAAHGFLDGAALLQFAKEKPPQLELVLTGRDPGTALLTLADYVTEMKKQKHPFDGGVQAREGIEY
jgi:cob(I)alamin adenosyltransferase